MARARIYADDAARQQAYRERQAWRNRNVTLGRLSMARQETSIMFNYRSKAHFDEFGPVVGEILTQIHERWGYDAACMAANAVRGGRG
jgi:hypothetical protein